VVQLGIPGIGDGVIVGSGGSAVVFAARAEDGTAVAVKLLRISADDERSRKQFEREADAIERLSEHGHIVPLLGSGTSDRGEPYLLMPLMAGSAQQTLDDHGPLRWDKALDLMLLVCDAIDHAHNKDVIHRDIKPANILLDGEGRPFVADFGIAKLVDGTQTMSSQVAATPSFAPPERFRGEPASKQSDVYSLAATYVALVTGSAPFGATGNETPEAVMRRVLDESPIDLEAAGLEVPGAIARVIASAMSKQPKDRPATARQLADELEQATGASRHQPTHHFKMALPENLTTTLLPASTVEPSINPSQTQISTEILRPSDEKANRRPMLALALLVALALSAVSWTALRGSETQPVQQATSTRAVSPQPATATPVLTPATVPTVDSEPEPEAEVLETTPTVVISPEPTSPARVLARATVPTVDSEPEPEGEVLETTPAVATCADLVDVAMESGLTTFVTAIQAAGAVELLTTSGPLTFFAPTDEAFGMLPPEPTAALLADVDLLTLLMTYHVAGYMSASDIVPGAVPPVAGSFVFLRSDERGLGVNNANFVGAEREAGECVLYSIDEVLLPPILGGAFGSNFNDAVGGVPIEFEGDTTSAPFPTLTGDSLDTLNKLCAYLDGEPVTDALGNIVMNHNGQGSNRLSDTVRDFLISCGLSASQVDAGR